MRFPILLACLPLFLAGCGREPAAGNAVELPEPSGPPVVQQVDNRTAPAMPAEPARK